MSQAQVLDAIQVLAGSIDGIDPERVVQGMPVTMPPGIDEYPYVVLETDAPKFTQKTMSDSGELDSEYTVYMTMFLGPADMQPQQALAAMVLYPERVRAKFAPSAALRQTVSTVLDHSFSNPQSNVRTYWQLAEQPKVVWGFAVREQFTVSALP